MTSPAFHDVLFPLSVGRGATGGPERLTEIVSLASGAEERNARWADSRRRYDAGLGLRSLVDIQTLVAFFEARMGRLHGFRWRDLTDFQTCPAGSSPSAQDCDLGEGDGARTVFKLQKRYRSGPAEYVRTLSKPVPGTVHVAVDGTVLMPDMDFVVSEATGEITLAHPPNPGERITAGCAFDVPVRFDTDRIEINLAAFSAGEVPSVPILEIRV